MSESVNYSLGIDLLKMLLKPGYLYFKCTDGEVYQAKIKPPEPNNKIYVPVLVPEEKVEE